MKVGDTNYGTIPATVTPVTVTGAFSYNATLTGDQSITGVGFTPRYVMCFMSEAAADVYSAGWSINGASTGISYVKASDANWYTGMTRAMGTLYSPGGQAKPEFVSIDSNGFTITRTKSSSPAGTVRISWACTK